MSDHTSNATREVMADPCSVCGGSGEQVGTDEDCTNCRGLGYIEESE